VIEEDAKQTEQEYIPVATHPPVAAVEDPKPELHKVRAPAAGADPDEEPENKLTLTKEPGAPYVEPMPGRLAILPLTIL